MDSTASVSGKLIFFVFQCIVWCFYHNIQSSFANMLVPIEELRAGRVHQCCCISNIFPNLCRHTGMCFSFESTGEVLYFSVDCF